MFKPVAVLLVSTLVLTSCGTVRESRLNPFNWFGSARSVPTDVANPLLPQRREAVSIFVTNKEKERVPGNPIAQVSELLIERRPGGAIIRATGVADRTGLFEAELILEDGEDPTVISYVFAAKQQPGPRNTGPDARKVTVADWLTDNELAGIRTIRVVGRENTMVTRR